jgi:hypothetical protein
MSLPIPEAVAMARLGRDLPGFLRTPLGIDEAGRTVRRRLDTREARFLDIARRAIFAHARSPYRSLLALAGCEVGDLDSLVRRDGLEGALSNLATCGVYLTFDEFKARCPIVRGSARLEPTVSDFDNPHAPTHLLAQTGGSRGRPTVVRMNLSFIEEQAASTAVALAAHGLSGHGHALWMQSAFTGLIPTLTYAKLGRPPWGWYHPLPSMPPGGRAATSWVHLLSRMVGRPTAIPHFNDLNDAGALAERLATHGPTCVTTYASSAVRIAVAARKRGVDLRQVCFITLGEPYTAAKRQAIEQAGGQGLPRYAFTEGGIVGYGCARPRAADDMHVFRDCLALVPRRRTTPGGNVDGFLFTSLLATAPKILLNVETGDYGRLERRECDCAIGATGLTDHVLEVRSFEKLSGEGISFVGVDLLRILEEVLPSRLGGTGGDYQIVEEEAEHGILRTVLVVSPRVTPFDERRARDVFLEALGSAGGADRLGSDIWRRAGTVEIRRDWPYATGAGKVLPFHVAR